MSDRKPDVLMSIEVCHSCDGQTRKHLVSISDTESNVINYTEELGRSLASFVIGSPVVATQLLCSALLTALYDEKETYPRDTAEWKQASSLMMEVLRFQNAREQEPQP